MHVCDPANTRLLPSPPEPAQLQAQLDWFLSCREGSEAGRSWDPQPFPGDCVSSGCSTHTAGFDLSPVLRPAVPHRGPVHSSPGGELATRSDQGQSQISHLAVLCWPLAFTPSPSLSFPVFKVGIMVRVSHGCRVAGMRGRGESAWHTWQYASYPCSCSRDGNCCCYAQ